VPLKFIRCEKESDSRIHAIHGFLALIWAISDPNQAINHDAINLRVVYADRCGQ
jgi:hypothetical protein